MKTRIVPLTEELLRWAVIEEADPFTTVLAEQPDFAAPFLSAGAIGAAMIGDGRVLAAGGLMTRWPGSGLAWLMLSPRATRQQRLTALRIVARNLDFAQRRPQWRRVEMWVRDDEPWGLRFAMFLGMRLEGVMEAFDTFGRDYKLFARVMPERPV